MPIKGCMKNLTRFSFVGLVAVLAMGCGFRTVAPDAGHEAVLIRKPLLFGSGGVDSRPVKPGLQYIAWTTQAVDVNMQPARVDAEFDDLMTADGVPIDFHAVISYIVIDSVKLVRDFGADARARRARLLDAELGSTVSHGCARFREKARHERDGDHGHGRRVRRPRGHRTTCSRS